MNKIALSAAVFGCAFASTVVAVQPTDEAKQLFEMTGIQGGLIVHVGCDDGRLTAALRRNERCLVQGLESNPTKLETARETIRSLGCYGPVSVISWDGARLPYADNLVTMLVVEERGRLSDSELLRVLAPLGALCVKKDGRWTHTIKPWPSNIDEWTHWLHDASSNPVARDTVIGPPRQMQWWASPVWGRSHEKSPSLTGMVTARGRLFYICDKGPPDIGGPLPDCWRLVARDAFNGVLLWEIPVPDWGWQAWSPSEPMNFRWGNPRFIHRRLVADGDRVFVTLGFSAPVTALDAATGKVIRTYAGTENTCEILYHQGRLVLSVATAPKNDTKSAPPLKIMVLDADTGKLLWQTNPFPSLFDLGERGKSSLLKQGFLMIAAGADRVLCVTDKEVVAFHLSDGTLAWKTPRPEPPKNIKEKAILADANRRWSNLGSLMVHDGRVFYAQPHPSATKLVNNVPMTLLCLSADMGRELWRRTCGDWSYTTSLNVYAARGLIWVHSDPAEAKYDLLGLAPETGEIKVRHHLASVLSTKHHHRCYRNKATENFLLMGKEGVEYVNWETGAAQPHRWLRGMCLFGIMPANGLLYVPPQACSCNVMTMLQGYWALAPANTRQTFDDSRRLPARLEKGPAYAEAVEQMNPRADDWPMYRRDPLRSGATTTSLRAALAPAWRAKLGGKLTAPVMADGRVYVGCADTHEIVALGAERGEVLWRFRTDGPMDSPPTFYRGMLLAGSSDGWVYCLRASDGRLRWRFRAAPQPRFVVSDDRVESAWPVHGSVMVHEDTVYVSAGRSSYLDGGIRLYMLDPLSGEVRGEKTFFTEQTDQEAYAEGVVSDLLVSDGKSLFMRHLRIDPKTLEISVVGSWTYKGPHPDTKPTASTSDDRAWRGTKEPHTYLRSGHGFLDDSLYGRVQFHLDGGEFCHLLCFNRERSYGFQMSTSTGHFVFFTPGKEGYTFLAFDRTRKNPTKRELWRQQLPLRAYGMVLAGEHLVLGGVPDVVPPDDPLAAFEGRLGGRLVVLEAQTGKKLSELKLDAPPVFDSLIAADGKLYLTDKAGTISCLQ